MTREKLLENIQQQIVGGDTTLFERYSNSELKKILDDMKTVKVESGESTKKTILVPVIIAVVGLIVAVILWKKLK